MTDALEPRLRPLRLMRYFHAPLVCLAIACVFSAGCSVRQEIVFLGEPTQAYRADNGAVLLGYDVQATPRVTLDTHPGAEYAGWHWLIIEPSAAKLLERGRPSGAQENRERVLTVQYEGWRSNARLVPPLLKPGLQDSNPPVVGDGGLTRLGFAWDSARDGVRLIDQDFAALALIRVSPDFATLRIREYDRDKMLTVLKVVAIAGLVTALVLLGGDTDISIN